MDPRGYFRSGAILLAGPKAILELILSNARFRTELNGVGGCGVSPLNLCRKLPIPPQVSRNSTTSATLALVAAAARRSESRSATAASRAATARSRAATAASRSSTALSRSAKALSRSATAVSRSCWSLALQDPEKRSDHPSPIRNDPCHPTGERKGRAGGPKNGVSLEPKWRRGGEQAGGTIAGAMTQLSGSRWRALTDAWLQGCLKRGCWKEFTLTLPPVAESATVCLQLALSNIRPAFCDTRLPDARFTPGRCLPGICQAL